MFADDLVVFADDLVVFADDLVETVDDFVFFDLLTDGLVHLLLTLPNDSDDFEDDLEDDFEVDLVDVVALLDLVDLPELVVLVDCVETIDGLHLPILLLTSPLFFCVFFGGLIGNFLNLKIFKSRTLAVITSLLVIVVSIRMGLKLFH